MNVDLDVLTALKPVTVESSENLIIASIRDVIAQGHLQPGETLPPERDLATRFGVSRGALRNALQRLQAAGLLIKLPQSGTRLSSGSREELIMAIEPLIASTPERLSMIFDFLDILEERALDRLRGGRLGDHAALAACLNDGTGEEEQGGPSFVDSAIALHAALIGVLRNALLSSLFLRLKGELRGFMEAMNARCPEHKTRVRALHAQVLDGIRTGNFAASSRALAEERALLRALLEQTPDGGIDRAVCTYNGNGA